MHSPGQRAYVCSLHSRPLLQLNVVGTQLKVQRVVPALNAPRTNSSNTPGRLPMETDGSRVAPLLAHSCYCNLKPRQAREELPTQLQRPITELCPSWSTGGILGVHYWIDPPHHWRSVTAGLRRPERVSAHSCYLLTYLSHDTRFYEEPFCQHYLIKYEQSGRTYNHSSGHARF